MGLGVLGRGLQVTEFLLECGADITVTDLKRKEDLESSTKKLSGKSVKYFLGGHRLEDFEDKDFVVKAAGVPLNSPFIEHAEKNGVKVVMDASLFARLVEDARPEITLVGVTGTRGKSMTTALIYYALKKNEGRLGRKIFLGGNMRNTATLPIIKKVQPGDIVVLELDSWQCQGFGTEAISPRVAVFTNLMEDHLNYYKNDRKQYLLDKSNIYKFQTKDGVLVTTAKLLKILTTKPKGRVILADKSGLKLSGLKIIGKHNLENARLATEALKVIGLGEKEILEAFKNFRGLEGRLQYLGKIKGVHVINDNNATTPEATVAGVAAVREKYKNIVLICGGSDKGLDLRGLAQYIKKFCHKTILLKGSGTEKLKKELGSNFVEKNNLKDAVKEAFRYSKKNGAILFSPGFASFGLFANEYERNDEFIRIIKRL